ncbi:hypothetical protein [Kitasatospora sp. NPDC088783]|uniref:hypothetical protein n=1 Tax=Kitasatospora sp. NPDC088783 TaxID=3364077 RepID=UPI00380DB3A4
MIDHYASEGVVWLTDPRAAADPFGSEWEHASAEQAASLQRDEPLTTAWKKLWASRENMFVLLPGEAAGTVAGLAWKSNDDGGLEGREMFERLDAFAAALPGAHAVVFGTGSLYNGDILPEVITYVPGIGFAADETHKRYNSVLFPPAERRPALFDRPAPSPTAPPSAPGTPARAPRARLQNGLAGPGGAQDDQFTRAVELFFPAAPATHGYVEQVVSLGPHTGDTYAAELVEQSGRTWAAVVDGTPCPHRAQTFEDAVLLWLATVHSPKDAPHAARHAALVLGLPGPGRP